MLRSRAVRLCFYALALALMVGPVAQSVMAARMEMGSVGAIPPDDCKGCVGDKALASACMTMCAVPAAVIMETPAVKPRANVLFMLPADNLIAGVSPIPDPPRPRPLLPA